MRTYLGLFLLITSVACTTYSSPGCSSCKSSGKPTKVKKQSKHKQDAIKHNDMDMAYEQADINMMPEEKPTQKKHKGSGKSTKAANNVIHITSKSELDTHTKSGKAVVLMVHAEWCGPCKQTIPHIENVASEYPDVVFVLGEELKGIDGVTGYPTFIFFDKSGKRTGKTSGGRSSDDDVRTMMNTYSK